MPDLTTHPALLVIALAVIAALLAEIPIGMRVPAGVLQVLWGMLIGPHGLARARVEGLLVSLGLCGTCALFCMAGMELDLGAVKGRPLSLAVRGWLVSLVLGCAAAGVLHIVLCLRLQRGSSGRRWGSAGGGVLLLLALPIGPRPACFAAEGVSRRL